MDAVKENKHSKYNYLAYLFLLGLIILQLSPLTKLKSVDQVFINFETFFFMPSQSNHNYFYKFAKEFSKKIPDGTKIVFIYDKKDFDNVKYYAFRFYMKPNISASHKIVDKIDSSKVIIKTMKSVNAQYLVLAARPDIIKLISPKSNAKSALFKLNNGKLELINILRI